MKLTERESEAHEQERVHVDVGIHESLLDPLIAKGLIVRRVGAGSETGQEDLTVAVGEELSRYEGQRRVS